MFPSANQTLRAPHGDRAGCLALRHLLVGSAATHSRRRHAERHTLSMAELLRPIAGTAGGI